MRQDLPGTFHMKMQEEGEDVKIKIEIETKSLNPQIDCLGAEDFSQVSPDEKPRLCCGCNQVIDDKYLLKIREQYWHERCMQCCVCKTGLTDSCYYKDYQLYCKEDYHRLYGCKCSGCGNVIAPDELVMRAVQSVYHTDCFKCDECGDKLEKGDEFILREGKLFCSADFNVAEHKSDIEVFSSDESESLTTASPQSYEKRMSTCKRPRTILTAQQRLDFKAAFELTPKPCRKVREQLSKETGLSVRVVQVWFQNQRAKLKKLQRKSEEGVHNDVLKKSENGGKVTKKKRTKSNSSTVKTDPRTPSSSDFNLPVTNPSSGNAPFENILDISNNYASQSSIPSYFGQHPPPELLSTPRTLHEYSNHLSAISRPPYLNSYPSISNGMMNGGLHPSMPHYGSGPPSYQIPPPVHSMSSSQGPPPPGEHLQIMHHLMNSF